jgi:hypothetical protein
VIFIFERFTRHEISPNRLQVQKVNGKLLVRMATCFLAPHLINKFEREHRLTSVRLNVTYWISIRQQASGISSLGTKGSALISSILIGNIPSLNSKL